MVVFLHLPARLFAAAFPSLRAHFLRWGSLKDLALCLLVLSVVGQRIAVNNVIARLIKVSSFLIRYV
jgi:hypothetical protein